MLVFFFSVWHFRPFYTIDQFIGHCLGADIFLLMAILKMAHNPSKTRRTRAKNLQRKWSRELRGQCLAKQNSRNLGKPRNVMPCTFIADTGAPSEHFSVSCQVQDLMSLVTSQKYFHHL